MVSPRGKSVALLRLLPWEDIPVATAAENQLANICIVSEEYLEPGDRHLCLLEEDKPRPRALLLGRKCRSGLHSACELVLARLCLATVCRNLFAVTARLLC